MTGKLLLDDRGGSAAEFALVLPVLLIFFAAILDGGRMMWEVNQAEKATQMGVRFAAVTTVPAGGLASKNFVGVTVGGVTLTQGDNIPASAIGTITCTSASCTCPSGCPSGIPGTYNNDAFQKIVDRIAAFKPNVQASNVTVEYRGSGLGFAGDPTGMDISPIITVKLSGLQFRPVSTLALARFSLPSFASSLTMEDGVGTVSN
ncbi:TadE/TadG family type IV pilus assembly protein [Sphingomonas sp. GCM10030256]|uniref:TadE/TadG family type IV pilus assembly protein n=1 Tax=Sphingomonas sp. GCM10030256 TaxID=3273427 RepID=UPI0036231D3F